MNRHTNGELDVMFVW